MVSGTEMPLREYNEETKKWVKTGKTELQYQCIFVKNNAMRNKLVFMVKDSRMLELEGNEGILEVKIGNNDFDGKNFIRFSAFDLI